MLFLFGKWLSYGTAGYCSYSYTVQSRTILSPRSTVSRKGLPALPQLVEVIPGIAVSEGEEESDEEREAERRRDHSGGCHGRWNEEGRGGEGGGRESGERGGG